MTKILLRLAFAVLVQAIAVLTFAQDSVYECSEAKIKLNMPNMHWHLYPKEEQNGFTIYVFKRDPIQDSSGRNIIPNAAVVIEKIDTQMDVVTYSVNKRANAAFEVTKMFIHGDGIISFLNAVGYQGTYTDQVQHIVYVVHAINGDKGMQLILDTTAETFPKMDKEFLKILKSFRKA